MQVSDVWRLESFRPQIAIPGIRRLCFHELASPPPFASPPPPPPVGCFSPELLTFMVVSNDWKGGNSCMVSCGNTSNQVLVANTSRGDRCLRGEGDQGWGNHSPERYVNQDSANIFVFICHNELRVAHSPTLVPPILQICCVGGSSIKVSM